MNRLINSLKGFFPWITVSDLAIIFAVIFILICILSLYVYFDTKNRGGKSLNWVIATILLGGVVPFIFYLMVRSPYTIEEVKEEKLKKEVIELQKRYYELMVERELERCPVCGDEVKAEYLFCPHCYTQLKKRCDKCGSVIEKSLKICPYCGNIFDVERKE